MLKRIKDIIFKWLKSDIDEAIGQEYRQLGKVVKQIQTQINNQPDQTFGLLTDKEISTLCVGDLNTPMIKPFCRVSTKELPFTARLDGSSGPSPKLSKSYRAISYGVSSCGYDITISDKQIQFFTPKPGYISDPKNFDPSCLRDVEVVNDETGEYFVLPAGTVALFLTNEVFHMPNDVQAIALGKSTYARIGVIPNITPLEPGWKGCLVGEIANVSAVPAKVYINEGIAQLLFFRTGDKPRNCYAEHSGKYDGQSSDQITYAKV